MKYGEYETYWFSDESGIVRAYVSKHSNGSADKYYSVVLYCK